MAMLLTVDSTAAISGQKVVGNRWWREREVNLYTDVAKTTPFALLGQEGKQGILRIQVLTNSVFSLYLHTAIFELCKEISVISLRLGDARPLRSD